MAAVTVLVPSGVQPGRGDDERDREQRRELFWSAEQGRDALGVLGQVGGMFVGGWLVISRFSGRV